MKKLLVSGLIVSASVLAVASVSAQDYTQPATYGSITLNTGFTPDPHKVAMQSGGSIQVTQPGCTGYVANAPDFELTYTAGTTFPLNIYVKSAVDTTLVINGPDGSWYCNDDSNGLNPLVSFPSPASGVYDIWVGTYGNNSINDAELNISEISPQW